MAARSAARGLALWHLLSLDAPSVAMLWTWFIAATNHIALPATAVLAMGIAVWALYAADRLLDSRALSADCPGKLIRQELEARHYFHRNHRRSFRCGVVTALIALAILVPQLWPQSVRLYLILGTLLAGYFILIHFNSSTSGPKTTRLPKEFAVGVFFSAAIFIPTVALDPGLRPALFPGAILFAVLCSLNCLFIYRWEHPADPTPNHAGTHPATGIALRFLPQLAAVAALSGLMLALTNRSLPWPVPAACGLAALLLLLLDRNRHRLSPTALRASADICLLTPLLFLHH